MELQDAKPGPEHADASEKQAEPVKSLEIGLQVESGNDAKGGVSSEQNTAALTVGSLGHVFRRTYHVGLFTSLSWLYYFHGIRWGEEVGFSAEKFISIVVMVQIALEMIRIKIGFICFGMRSYERYQISAQAWGAVGAVLVLLAAPQRNINRPFQSAADKAYIGMPIIWTLGIIDPFIGELKGHGIFGRWYRNGQGFNAKERIVLSTIVAVMIWVGIGLVIGESEWWFVAIVAPLSIAAEFPSLKIIDDNGMLCLVPLGAALLLRPFFDLDDAA